MLFTQTQQPERLIITFLYFSLALGHMYCRTFVRFIYKSEEEQA